MAVSDGHQVRMHKDMGLVGNVFNEEILKTLPGSIAIGHTRYSTTGASVIRNAQPIYCVSNVGEIAVAHNGNLINSAELRAELEAEGEVMDTTADSELIARLFAMSLPDGVEFAVKEVMRRMHGAFSVTVLTPNMLLGFRDPYGIRPLSVGKVRDGWMIASESCAFEPVGATFEEEVLPGECVVIDAEGKRTIKGVENAKHHMCLFEFIYFARPDSVVYGTTLYKVRERMGAALANEHPVDADLVVPVPDSGIPAAIGYAKESGIPFEEAMMKNRYIHRTFIQPDQHMRELGVKMKLSPLRENIEGKRLILVDDSIVRGTTTNQIVKLMYDCGAKEVHVRITAPPIKYPCFYGIDMASKGELIASTNTVAEIAEHLGADSLGYLSVEGARRAVAGVDTGFCDACFTGDYPLPVPKALKKMAFEDPPTVGAMANVTMGQMKLPGAGEEG